VITRRITKQKKIGVNMVDEIQQNVVIDNPANEDDYNRNNARASAGELVIYLMNIKPKTPEEEEVFTKAIEAIKGLISAI